VPTGDPDRAERLQEAQTLYEKGLRRMRRGYYEDAITIFEKVRSRFPLSRVAVLSELRIADCHYENSDMITAGDAYDRFARLHPAHEEVPYALFRKGAAYLKLAPARPALDQSDTSRGLVILTDYQERFPESPYAEEASNLYAKGRTRLARKEAQIGHFYFRQKAWSAAIGRYTGALRDFPEVRTGWLARAAWNLARCHSNLGQVDSVGSTLTMIADHFPDTRHAERAQAEGQEMMARAAWNRIVAALQLGDVAGVEDSLELIRNRFAETRIGTRASNRSDALIVGAERRAARLALEEARASSED
jgi:outer membrane protein assembly factor BamD